MRYSSLVLIAFLALLSSSSPARSAKPRTAVQIRPLVKEPDYEHAPRYALFVFGPKDELPVWMVLDAKDEGKLPEVMGHLYVDRNGNGDLTEKGERISFSNLKWVSINLETKNGNEAYEIHFLRRVRSLDEKPLRAMSTNISAKDVGSNLRIRFTRPDQRIPIFAESVKKARIAYIGGRWVIGPDPTAKLMKQDKSVFLRTVIFGKGGRPNPVRHYSC